MAENKPIVRVYFAKLKEAFFNLSEEEKMDFMRKDRGNLDELGCKFETIDCRWSNEEWDFIGIEEWPSLEAIEKRAKFEKEELQVSRYVNET
jgi:hypothetical protein